MKVHEGFHEGPRRFCQPHEGPRRPMKAHEGPRRSTKVLEGCRFSGPAGFSGLFAFRMFLQEQGVCRSFSTNSRWPCAVLAAAALVVRTSNNARLGFGHSPLA